MSTPISAALHNVGPTITGEGNNAIHKDGVNTGLAREILWYDPFYI